MSPKLGLPIPRSRKNLLTFLQYLDHSSRTNTSLKISGGPDSNWNKSANSNSHVVKNFGEKAVGPKLQWRNTYNSVYNS